MLNSDEYTAITEYFEAGFTCTEISLELNIPYYTVVTYLSKWLTTKQFSHFAYTKDGKYNPEFFKI
jgi:hypothetical protein